MKITQHGESSHNSYDHGVLIRVNTILYNFYTVNSEIFARILFSGIVLKATFATLKILDSGIICLHQ